ncbi:MAG TPA: glycosyltransferase family 1 protein [Longimicrobiaceae bacterium]|nr:glycosyltransferase family 1 protein [Longimicrobiaceae bacterium]
MSNVAVDVRMLGRSGIGRYIEQVVPRVFSAGGLRGTLLGDVESMRSWNVARSMPAFELLPCDAPIYSIREQLAMWRATPRDSDLFWSPHYNIPVLVSGNLVVTVHDVLHLARPEHVQGAHRRLYARSMLQAVRRKADAILCDSQFTADELMRLTGVGADAMHVIPLGVDEECFRVRSDDPPHDRPYFLFVGNIKPHKNLGRLVAAFGSVADELPHDLIIVGQKEGFLSGDERVVEDAAALKGRVLFTGRVDDDAVHRYLAHAEALVLPSTYEGFGLPALEAMAAGCPVIVSDVASLPEVCGDAAVYIDPYDPRSIADAMRRVAESRALRDELREKGLSRAREFSWDACARDTRQVIQAVLAG